MQIKLDQYQNGQHLWLTIPDHDDPWFRVVWLVRGWGPYDNHAPTIPLQRDQLPRLIEELQKLVEKPNEQAVGVLPGDQRDGRTVQELWEEAAKEGVQEVHPLLAGENQNSLRPTSGAAREGIVPLVRQAPTSDGQEGLSQVPQPTREGHEEVPIKKEWNNRTPDDLILSLWERMILIVMLIVWIVLFARFGFHCP